MSFRKEKKFLVDQNHTFTKINNFLFSNKFKKIYPDRKIYSVYFDNKNLDMFQDSEEGVVPRKKIRIRWYNSRYPKQNYFFEKKINSVEGRFKTSEKIISNSFELSLRKGFHDNLYGQCKPKIMISYKRSYFENNNKIRITIDRDIKYKKNIYSELVYRKNKNDLVLEIKYQNFENLHLLKELPVREIRYSKYNNGILNIYN